VWAAVM